MRSAGGGAPLFFARPVENIAAVPAGRMAPMAPSLAPDTMQSSVPGIYVIGTAVAGTQDKFSVFIENCHVHVDRIIAAITGEKPPENSPEFLRPET